MGSQRDNRVKVSALLHAGQKVREVANLVGVSRTTVCAIKKYMDDGEGINRRAGSGRKTVVNRDGLRDVIRGNASMDAIRGTDRGHLEETNKQADTQTYTGIEVHTQCFREKSSIIVTLIVCVGKNNDTLEDF